MAVAGLGDLDNNGVYDLVIQEPSLNITCMNIALCITTVFEFTENLKASCQFVLCLLHMYICIRL